MLLAGRLPLLGDLLPLERAPLARSPVHRCFVALLGPVNESAHVGFGAIGFGLQQPAFSSL